MTRQRREGTATARNKGEPLEADVARWWHQGGYNRVVTTTGRSLQVLYPGRPSPQAGPDFRDSLLATEEGDLIRGDVEVHLRQGDWVGHGHHQDLRYRDVVLHLFLHGKRGGALPEMGAQVQEVALGSSQPAALLRKAPSSSRQLGKRHVAAPLERLRTLPLKELGRVLDEAGERRFMIRALEVMEHIRRGDPEEEMYAGLMEALGYSQNRVPMSLLARGLPLRGIRELVGAETVQPALEALLLGAGGLLPHQRGLCLPGLEEEEHARDMEALWRRMGGAVVVPRGMWSGFRLRPHNQPSRRLVGASFLTGEHWRRGLVEGLRALMSQGLRETERGLEVRGRDFWALHLDYHRPVAQAPALVGKGRARDMVVNVVLPFFFAQAYLSGDRDLGRRALSLYRACPPGQDNEITREVGELLLASRSTRPVVNSARRQQGLLHLYHVLGGRAR